jgi:toxin ParE1/3/4
VTERRLVVLPRADADVVEIFARIAADDVAAADRFKTTVHRECAILTQFPEFGRARRYRGRDVGDLRSFPLSGFRNWLVFYRVRSDVIEIVRVLHGARDLRRALRS